MVSCPLIKLILTTLLFMEVKGDAPMAAIRTKGQCTCITPDGAEYNLMPLRRSDGIPRFNVRSLRLSFMNYTYNPCIPVTLPKGSTSTPCYQVALCTIIGAGYSRGIGVQDGVKCIKTSDGVLELVYQIRGDILTSSVQLICDPEKKTLKQAVFKPLNEETLRFGLIHRCACPNGCPSAGDEKATKGTKTMIVLIISIISIVALCVVVALGCYCSSRHAANNNGHDDEQRPILEQGERTGRNQEPAFGVANESLEDENDIGRAKRNRVGYEVSLREHADPRRERRGHAPRNQEKVPVENSDEGAD